jgi:bifunctional pyridoxal-dependent enzyme with beta-cystathionase and maltose regulon repressor activities
VDRGINTDEVAEPNTFAIQAAEAAFDEGEEWLEELREYLELNREFLIGSLKELVPEVQVIEAEATYLAWIDCAAITRTRRRCARSSERRPDSIFPQGISSAATVRALSAGIMPARRRFWKTVYNGLLKE